jgi:hypothetical protein
MKTEDQLKAVYKIVERSVTPDHIVDTNEMIPRETVKEWIETAFGNGYLQGEMDQRKWWIDRINDEIDKVNVREFQYNQFSVKEVIGILINMLPDPQPIQDKL